MQSLTAECAQASVTTAFDPFPLSPYIKKVTTPAGTAIVRCTGYQEHKTSASLNSNPDFRVLGDLKPLGGIMYDLNGTKVFLVASVIWDSHSLSKAFFTINGQGWETIALIETLPAGQGSPIELLMSAEIFHLRQIPETGVHHGSLLISRQLAETLKTLNDDKFKPETGLFEYHIIDEDIAIIKLNQKFFRLNRATQGDTLYHGYLMRQPPATFDASLGPLPRDMMGILLQGCEN